MFGSLGELPSLVRLLFGRSTSFCCSRVVLVPVQMEAQRVRREQREDLGHETRYVGELERRERMLDVFELTLWGTGQRVRSCSALSAQIHVVWM